MRDFSHFSENSFVDEVSHIDWESVSGAHNDPDHSFSTLYSKVKNLLDEQNTVSTSSQTDVKTLDYTWAKKINQSKEPPLSLR